MIEFASLYLLRCDAFLTTLPEAAVAWAAAWTTATNCVGQNDITVQPRSNRGEQSAGKCFRMRNRLTLRIAADEGAIQRVVPFAHSGEPQFRQPRTRVPLLPS